MTIYGRKARGMSMRFPRVNEDDCMCMPKEQMDNSIYGVEEDLLRDHYHMMTRKLNTFECEDLEDCDGLINEQNVNNIYGSGFHIDEKEIIVMTCHRGVFQRGFASKERISVKNGLEYLPEYPVRYGKYRGKCTDMIPKSVHMKGFQSNHYIGKITGFYKNQNIVNANEGYFEDNLEDDSDEFKKLTKEAFLKFSKEFCTTEDFVKHAFMARRAQLRANHLGQSVSLWDGILTFKKTCLQCLQECCMRKKP
ncbi:hypothetical protein SAY87_029645 [Trapa incisa]|uniref:Uncharacterized protein n=1 Tax=Trapa incisa TaxID=236973 RepID=A0AAN7Q8Z9_9MYRT|nr:hypothetical protein SAY87_029645 [Trapa incisa]